MGEQTDAVISDVTIDEYGTIWRGEQIIGDIEPVDDEGSDVSVIAVWDMGALLDALDAVPGRVHRQVRAQRDEADRTCDERLARAERAEAENRRLREATDSTHRDALRGWSEALARVERAERERDALRAVNARLREALQSVVPTGCWCRRLHVSLLPCDPCRARAALSADATADAEPPPAFSDHYVAPEERVNVDAGTVRCSGWHGPGAPYSDGCSGDAGPSRAEQIYKPGEYLIREEPSRAEGGEEEHDCAAAHQLAVEIATSRVRELEAALREIRNSPARFGDAVTGEGHEWCVIRASVALSKTANAEK